VPIIQSLPLAECPDNEVIHLEVSGSSLARNAAVCALHDSLLPCLGGPVCAVLDVVAWDLR
jgi:hypothetical protein